jgi:hypothetical protein
MSDYSSSSSAGVVPCRSTAVALSEAVLDLYNWPSDKGETWRHVTNFDFVNAKQQFASLEAYEGSSGKFTLTGYLLPPPTTGQCLLKRLVKINISHFSIDFGDDDSDESRGFWLCDFEDAWYKLEEPTPEFARIANLSKEKCEKFLEFYDVVVHMEVPLPGGEGGGGGGYLSSLSPETNLYSCCFDLQQLLDRSGSGSVGGTSDRGDGSNGHSSSSFSFDLQYLKRNACFYVEQVENQFKNNCALMVDLRVSGWLIHTLIYVTLVL